MKHALIFSLTALLSFPQIGRTQEESNPETPAAETTTATGPSGNTAWLRTWTMIAPDVYPPIVGDQPSLKENLCVMYDGADGKPAFVLSNAVPFATSGYNEMPTGTQELRLVRQTGATFVELARAKAELKPDSFLTAVVQRNGGAYSLSVVDDTPKPPPPPAPGEPPPPPPKTIIFYNFLQNSTVVSCEDPSFNRTVSFARPQLVSELPGKIFNVSMPVKSGKREYLSSVEVDLQAYDSLSFVIVQDFYGRTIAKVLPNAKVE